MPDREACAAELAGALQQSPASTKTTILEILAEVDAVLESRRYEACYEIPIEMELDRSDILADHHLDLLGPQNEAEKNGGECENWRAH